MQTARHLEAAERKQREQSEPTQLLSKMTNRKQGAGLMVLRGGSILQDWLIPQIHSEQMTSKKGKGPGVATRARQEGE